MNLDVPFFSQKEEEVVELYGYGGCGLISLRMVLAFYLRLLKLKQLNYLAKQELAFDNNKGWIHCRLINIARKLGFKGFRINYKMLTDRDLKKAHQVFLNEGYSHCELELFTQNFHLAKKQGALKALDELLDQQIPVIASMKRNYANTPTTHIVVIKGKKDDRYILNDPWNFGPGHKISIKKFSSQWTQRAIVIFQEKSLSLR